jgi:hypothetical protein
MAASVAGLALLVTTGCVTTGSFIPSADGPPAGDPCKVVATWNNQVMFTPDPTHGGNPIPGIAGRMYLFGPKVDFPMTAEGMVVADLFDAAQTGPNQQPVLLEEWRIDKDTLKRLLRRDAIGWGYTLFLPWGTYKPDITKIQMKLRFEPVHGVPLYTENARVTLNPEGTTEFVPVNRTTYQPGENVSKK